MRVDAVTGARFAASKCNVIHTLAQAADSDRR